MEVISQMIIGMFLYFPEDKSEYIPAAITFGICVLCAIGVMVLVNKHSKKQEIEAKKLEMEIMKKIYRQQ
ncbi:MAG: hypothetical protein ACI35P_14835 [Bacillus sp. (in: firmicutes)]